MARDQTAEQEAQEAEGPHQVDGLRVCLEVVGEEGLHGTSDGLDGSVTQLPHPGNADIADAPGDLSRRQLGEQFFHASPLLCFVVFLDNLKKIPSLF